MIYTFKILSQKYGKAIQIVVCLIVLFCAHACCGIPYDKAFKVQNNSNRVLDCYCFQDTISEDNFMNFLDFPSTIQAHSKGGMFMDIPDKGNVFTHATSGIITIILIDIKKAHDPKINPFADTYSNFNRLPQISKYICIVYEIDVNWMIEHDWIITYPYPNDPNVKYVRSVNGILTTSVENFGPHFPFPTEN